LTDSRLTSPAKRPQRYDVCDRRGQTSLESCSLHRKRFSHGKAAFLTTATNLAEMLSLLCNGHLRAAWHLLFAAITPRYKH